MANSPEQQPNKKSQIPLQQQPKNPPPLETTKQPASSDSGSAERSNKGATAAEIAKAKLAEKKNVRGRPVGSTKVKPAEDPKPDAPVVREKPKFKISPKFAATIYKHIVNGYARSLKADPLLAEEIQEFEQQYADWIELEKFDVNPLYMARIGMISAVGMPILIRHPIFERIMEKIAGDFLAEQNNNGDRPEGPRQDNLGAAADQNKEPAVNS